MRWLLVVAFLLFFAWNNSVYASILHRDLQAKLDYPDYDVVYGNKAKGGKSKGKGNGGKGKPPPPPVNQLCLTKLAAIWWSWFYCYRDQLIVASNSCPVQDKRIPAKTTFLIVDRQPQNCSSFKPNERSCTIPADNWIVLPAATNSYASDFVSVVNTTTLGEVDNTEDTPEFLKSDIIDFFDSIFKNVTATVVQQVNSTTNKTTTYDPPTRHWTLKVAHLIIPFWMIGTSSVLATGCVFLPLARELTQSRSKSEALCAFALTAVPILNLLLMNALGQSILSTLSSSHRILYVLCNHV
jgi:hypothetical protein